LFQKCTNPLFTVGIGVSYVPVVLITIAHDSDALNGNGNENRCVPALAGTEQTWPGLISIFYMLTKQPRGRKGRPVNY
jgi:hypothetical protein